MAKVKASELRIGSKIGCKVSNDVGVYKVCALPKWTYESSQPVTIDRCGYETHPIEKLKPIALTEEWLQKFGFDRMSCPEIAYRLNDVVIDIDPESFDGKAIWYFWLVSGQVKRMACLSYVHQLQNLYFCLTGEELSTSVSEEVNK